MKVFHCRIYIYIDLDVPAISGFSHVFYLDIVIRALGEWGFLVRVSDLAKAISLELDKHLFHP